jgi:hypothetical protein
MTLRGPVVKRRIAAGEVNRASLKQELCMGPGPGEEYRYLRPRTDVHAVGAKLLSTYTQRALRRA